MVQLYAQVKVWPVSEWKAIHNACEEVTAVLEESRLLDRVLRFPRSPRQRRLSAVVFSLLQKGKE